MSLDYNYPDNKRVINGFILTVCKSSNKSNDYPLKKKKTAQ